MDPNDKLSSDGGGNSSSTGSSTPQKSRLPPGEGAKAGAATEVKKGGGGTTARPVPQYLRNTAATAAIRTKDEWVVIYSALVLRTPILGSG